MSEKQLRDMIEYASGWAGTRFAKVGAIAPFWHAMTASGETLVLAPPFQNKDASAAFFRALFKERDVVRYVMIDEAWLAKIDPSEKEHYNRRGVRSHPQRVEIVMFNGEDHEGGQIMAYRRIERPNNGPAYLGPLEWQRYNESEGRFVGLLPTKGTKQ